MGWEGEGSGGRGGGKRGERGREVGIGYPPVHPLQYGNANTKSTVCGPILNKQLQTWKTHLKGSFTFFQELYFT